MTPPRNISLVYGSDRGTLQRAVMLAQERGARLTIVYPVRPIADAEATVTAGGRTVDVRRLVYEDERSRLKEAERTARAAGVRVSSRLLVGNPVIEVTRDAADHERDLVIMTAEGPGGLRERLFGSTSRHLMRQCPAPLMVVRPGRRTRFRQILAAIDPQVDVDAPEALNRSILGLAAWLAARDRAALHVVHAWALVGEAVYRGRAGVPAAEVDRLAGREMSRRRREVETLVAGSSARDARLHLPKGDPATVIPRIVRTHAIDLLVIGTVSRAGLTGLLVGNTAERVLDQVDCSVLAVKPAGFVPPVLAG